MSECPKVRYRNDDGTVFKERKWNLFTREWTRPAIIKSKMKGEVSGMVKSGQGREGV